MQKLLLTLSFLLLTNFLFAQCSGTPVGGTTYSSDPVPCVFIPFTLTSVGSSYTNATDFNCQWQDSTTSSGAWIDIAGAIDPTYSIALSTVGQRFYRRKIICISSNDSAYSTILNINCVLCYCTSGTNFGTSTGYYIDRVKYLGGSLDNITGPSSSPYYNNYGISSADSFMQGAYQTIRVYTGLNTNSQNISAWIDFNLDGDMFDAGEYLSWNHIVQGGLGNYTDISFQVPMTAIMGYTYLKIRLTSGANGFIDPCLMTSPNYDFGETEDYIIYIKQNVCIGNTVPGTISVASSAGNIFCMNNSGYIGNLVGWQVDWSAPYNFMPPDNSVLDDTLCIDTALAGAYFAGGQIMYTRAMYQNNGCPVAYSNAVLLESPCPIAIADTVTDASCGNNDGAIAVTVTGGVAQSYLWSNGETTEDVSNLLAGNYSVTVTDTSACFNSFSFTVNNSNGPTATETHLNSTCAGGTGSINLSVTGGTTPYTYLWSNGSTTEDISSLLGGTYSVTVSDFNNCNGFLSATLLDSSFYMYVFIYPTIPNACTSNGALYAYPSGGIPSYQYLWSNGGSTQTISGLAPGNYSLTVTDNIGCEILVTNYFLTNNNSASTIQGQVFEDLNNNCVFDTSDYAYSYELIEATDSVNGINAYGFTDWDGTYSILIYDTGNYVIGPYAYFNCGTFQPCVAGSVQVNSLCNTYSGMDFTINGVVGHDLEILPFCFPGNPGFDKEYVINVWDNNYPSYTDTVTVTFNYDTALIYSYSFGYQPIQDSVNHTLTWKVLYGYNTSISFDCVFNVPANLSTNYQVHSEFTVDPIANDCYTANNQIVFDEPITSSFDPNSKQVSPSGNLTSVDSVLTYTIHFQNTGNDTTHFVILKDTLSQYLNPATVENITASAPFDFTISGSGILTWIFNPLFLPDSASNEAMSKGFVQFKVKLKPNLPNGSLIENTASIYFDYNVPIVTNTIQNSIINSISEMANENDLTIYPNPFNNQLTVQLLRQTQHDSFTISITNILGQEVFRSQTNLKSVICNFELLPQGIYFLKLTDGTGMRVVKKIVKQ